MSTPVGKCIAALKTSFSNIIDLSITSLFSNKFWLSMHRKCNNLASFFDLPIRVINLLGQSHMKFQRRVTSQIWFNDLSHDSQHPIIMLYTKRFCNEIASWINPKSLDPKLSPFHNTTLWCPGHQRRPSLGRQTEEQSCPREHGRLQGRMDQSGTMSFWSFILSIRKYWFYI